MAVFFIYSLKAGVCLAWFYLFHKLLLSRDTFHTFNRLMLLTVVVVSLLLPLVHVTLSQPMAINQGTVVVEGFLAQAVVAEEEQHGLTLAQWLFLIYIIGVAFFLLRGAFSVMSIMRLMHRATTVDMSDGIRTLTLPGNVSPFSWFRYIVLSEADWTEHRREIILHERAHIAHYHSLDVLLCNVLIVFQWFNPAAWLIKRELQAVHEFEADEAVLGAGVDAHDYQMLLIRKAVGERLFAMANNLNHNSLKKRIKMMNIQKSRRAQMLKAAAIIPLAALAITAFASNKVVELSKSVETEAKAFADDVKAEAEALAGGKGSTAIQPQPSASESETPAALAAEALPASTDVEQAEAVAPADTADAVTSPDVLPQFNGNVNMFIAQNIQYPLEAAEKNIQGRVIVKFIIGKDGVVSNASVVRGVHPLLDAEALRVVNAMTNWTPGTVAGKPVSTWYTLPVNFRLTNGEAASPKSKNVWVIDGKVANTEDIENLDTSAVTVLDFKNDEATKKQYGAEGKGFVIFVSTKKQ